jgi:SAM-dependent methyltransferase
MSSLAWSDGVGHELHYWEGVLRKQAQEGQNFRRPQTRDLSYLVSNGCIRSLEDEVRYLDVGSGPFAAFAPPEYSRAEFIYADALGDQFNELLDKYCFVNMPRIRNVRGEELVKTFGEEAFHHVNCANALDHCENPHLVFLQMLQVCKKGGIVSVVSFENEGEREQYHGFHQWNLQADSFGFWLWSPSLPRTNLLAGIPYKIDFHWKYVDHGQKGFNIFVAETFKKS